MRKDRNPEYFNRDRLFKESCSHCNRYSRCTFHTSLGDGPEGVCVHLIQSGTQDCEVCLRYKKVCHFKCCFFQPRSGYVVPKKEPFIEYLRNNPPRPDQIATRKEADKAALAAIQAAKAAATAKERYRLPDNFYVAQKDRADDALSLCKESYRESYSDTSSAIRVSCVVEQNGE